MMEIKMTEQIKDPIQLAIDALEMADLYVQGYHEPTARRISLALEQLHTLQSQPAAVHGVEGPDAGKPFPRSDNGICENPECKGDGARWLKHGVKCCFICRPDTEQFAQSRQPLPADKQAALRFLEAWEEELNEMTDYNSFSGVLDTIRAALTAPQPVAFDGRMKNIELVYKAMLAAAQKGGE